MPESTNPKKEGRRIHNVTLQRDPDVGATVVLVSAGMGGVKTAACLDYAEKIMRKYPEEKVFWRESIKSPVQFTKFTGFPWRVFVERGYNLVFKNIRSNELFMPEGVVYFDGLEDLLSKSSCGVLNVVFFKDIHCWRDFIEFLNNIDGWHTIIMDEIEDVFPSGTRDKEWHWMQTAADVIKHCRRGLTTIVGNVHKGRAIDYRILDKVMIYFYGFGAKPDGHSRINRSCFDTVKRGEFWVEEEHTRFGYIRIGKRFVPVGDPWTIYEQIE